MYTSHLSGGDFVPLLSAPYSVNTCLTHSFFLAHSTSLHLYTAANNGHIAVWDISSVLGQHPLPVRNGALILDREVQSLEGRHRVDQSRRNGMGWFARKAAHQNSVKSMSVIALSDNDALVVSGGDDNALSFTRFASFSNGGTKSTIISSLNVARAHASTITALAVLPVFACRKLHSNSKHQLKFVTASNDQRLKVWSVDVDLCQGGVEGVTVRKVANVHSSVADVSSMEVFVDNLDGEIRVLLCGVGMELWTVTDWPKGLFSLHPEDATCL